MENMTAIVEIDKLGRLVVPKKMRDAMHLRAGDKLSVRCNGTRLILDSERKPRGLYREQGWLVYDSGGPPLAADTVVRAIHDIREERDRHNLNLGEQE